MLKLFCEIMSFVGNYEFIEALFPILAFNDIAYIGINNNAYILMLQLFFETLSFVGNCEFIEALLPIFICCNYLVSKVAIMF